MTQDRKKCRTTVTSPYMKDGITVAPDGYVYAPTKPGLGYEIDRDKLEELMQSVN